jgi:hypothetical protein
MKRDFERRTRQHRLDPAQIGDRLIDVRSRLIGYRKGPQATEPSPGLLFAEGRRRRLLEPVRPVPPRLRKSLLKRCRVD